MLRWDPLLPLHAVGVAVTVAMAVLAWRRRATTPLAATLCAEMVAMALWTALVTLGSVSTSPVPIEVAALAVPPVAAATASGALLLCLQVHQRTGVLDRRGAVLLAVEPVLVTLAAATNGRHHLLFTAFRFVGSPPVAAYRPGPAFWLHTGYCYLTIVAGLAVLVRSWHAGPRYYRRQLASLLVAQLVPVLGNVVSLAALAGGGHGGDTAVLFLVSALMMSRAVFRQGLLRIAPIARQLVLEQVEDAVLVLGPDGTIVDHNGALRRLVGRFPRPPAELVGLDARQVLGRDASLVAGAAGRLRLDLRDGVAELDYRLTALHDRAGRPIGTVAVTHDVTAETHQARALQEANAQLRQQLEVIEELRAELAEQATRDELTGLHNRRHLLKHWAAALEQCRRDGRELAVLIIDADRFKAINDEHGHPVGDQVLIALGAALAAALRPGDLLARYGGEEFVAVLPGAGAGAARRRAEQMRQQCAAHVVPAPAGPVAATVSIGVATFPRCGQTPAALLHAADQALYRAKAGGRDRVVTSGPAGPAGPAPRPGVVGREATAAPG